MKKKLINLVKNFLLPNIAWTILISLPSAIAGLVSSAKLLLTKFSNASIPWYLILIFVIANIICVSVLFIDSVLCIYYFYTKKKRPVFPTITSDYQVESAEFELYFRDRTHIINKTSTQIIALKDEVKELVYNMMWTGQTYKKSELISGADRGIKLIDSTRSSSPHKISIQFNRPLSRYNKEKIEFHTHVEDKDQLMLPFYSKVIKSQMDQMTIRVVAPVGLLKNVNYLITADQAREIILEKPKELPCKKIGEYEVYEQQVSKPELLHFYVISWSF